MTKGHNGGPAMTWMDRMPALRIITGHVMTDAEIAAMDESDRRRRTIRPVSISRPHAIIARRDPDRTPPGAAALAVPAWRMTEARAA